MGNFYTSVVVPGADAPRVAAVVEGLGRRAIVAGTGRAAFVYDAQCDDQDRAVIEQFASAVSSSCGIALAVSNHDDDVLWYALARDGQVIDSYDSNPGYVRGERLAPAGGDAALLTDAFGVPDARERVEALLRRAAGGGACEIDRHGELCELLRIPAEPSVLGYRYVSRGELVPGPVVSSLFGIGGAVIPSVDGKKGARGKSIDPEFQERINASCLALERAEVQFDDRFAPITGTGRMNAWLAMMKVNYYVKRVGLGVPGHPLLVRCDELLAGLLGVSEFSTAELSVIAQRAFGVPSLTADELRESRDRSSALGRELTERRRSLHAQYTDWILNEVAALAGHGGTKEIVEQLSARIRGMTEGLRPRT